MGLPKLAIGDQKLEGGHWVPKTGAKKLREANAAATKNPNPKNLDLLEAAKKNRARLNGSSANVASLQAPGLATIEEPNLLWFWDSTVPQINFNGHDMPLCAEEFLSAFDQEDFEWYSRLVPFLKNCNSVPVAFGKENDFAASFWHAINKDQYARLDTALLFVLSAGDNPVRDGRRLAAVLTVADDDVIDIAIHVISRDHGFCSPELLANAVKGLAKSAGNVLPSQIHPTFGDSHPPGWFDSAKLIRKAAQLVSISIVNAKPSDSAIFKTTLENLFKSENLPTRKLSKVERINQERASAIQAGMLIAGALDAASKMDAADEARKDILKDSIAGVIGAALGGAGVPGAILAPAVTAAVQVAIDVCWQSRDFTKGANMIRGELELFKLNSSDIARTNGVSDEDATRYIAWMNAAVHCMGYA